MKRILLTTLLVTASAAPASAALVSTYGMTDDVWAAPLAAGKFAVDVRGLYTLSSSLTPAMSLVYGLGNNLEVGLFGAYGFNGLGTSTVTSAAAPLSPYLKYQLPFKVGAGTLGLNVGGQIPLAAATERNVAVEGVLAYPITDALSVDLNVGYGMTFLAPTNLGHLGLTAYYTLPGGTALCAEVYNYMTSPGPNTMGGHLGATQPLNGNTSLDLSVAMNNTAGANVVIPQLGVTCLF